MAKKEVLNTAVATVRVAEPVAEVIEGVEAVVDTVEDIFEDTVNVIEKNIGHVTQVTRNNPYLIAGVAVASLAVGGYVGYRYGFKKAGLRFEAELEVQLQAAAEHYQELMSKHAAKGTIILPAKPTEVLQAEEPEVPFGGPGVPEGVSKAVSNYKGIKHVSPVPAVVTDHPEDEIVDPSLWNLEVEIADREVNPGKPYVISHEEFQANELNHEQSTLTYFHTEDTLMDERSMPLDNADYLVGDDNLQHRFGHGSGNADTMYVRNEHLDHDFEIVRSGRSYKKDVLGLTEEEDGRSLRHSHRASRRSRSADE